MATRIITKNGSGAPLASDLQQGELAVDLTNKRLYTENASGTVLELGTSPSTIDINAGTIDGTVIGGSSAAAGSFTTISASGEIAANGGVAFGDNDKATFGDSDDLQIYHDGTHSYVSDQGTGSLFLRSGSNIYIQNAGGTANYFKGTDGAASELFYSGASKLATTSTGIDVTGTVTADGLTVDGDATVGGASGGKLGIAGQGIDAFATTTEPSIYRTGSGGSDIFAAAGHLVIQPRTSAARSVNIATSADGVSTLKRASFADNGDISFYEDTGTTAKFFWDASAEFLGIGTSTPSRELEVTGAGNVYLKLTAPTSTDATAIEFANVDATWTLSNNDSDDSFSFSNGTERARLDSSGNLTVGAPSATRLEVSLAENDKVDLKVVDSTSTARNMTFSVGASEAARIDSSRNLLVGNTVTNPSSNYSNQRGFAYINSTGKVEIATTANDVVMDIGKNNANDGSLVAFRKEGTIVGNIGTGGALIGIGGGTGNLGFFDATIVPMGNTSGGASDGVITLGSSARRFKDLYLSGGVYLGGTGAANLLDDYEEGTWTPEVADASSAGNVSATAGVGNYTKVGRMVTVTCALANINTSGLTAGNVVFVRNLPFATADISGATTYYVGSAFTSSISANGAVNTYGQDAGNTWVAFYDGGSILVSDLTSGSADIYFTLTYETA